MHLLLPGVVALLSAAALPRPAVGERGRAVYLARCADCHGRSFEGVEEAPALTGARFEAKWRGQTVRLYEKIRRSMPQDDPGSLSQADAADLVALVSAANHGRLATTGAGNQLQNELTLTRILPL